MDENSELIADQVELINESLSLLKQSIERASIKASLDLAKEYKDYLLPTPKSDLFNENDIVNKDILLINFRRILIEVRNESRNLFTNNEIEILDSFDQLSANSQALYLLLLFKKEMDVN